MTERNKVLFCAMLLSWSSLAYSQVYVGIGYVSTQLGEQGLDNAAGFSLILEKEYSLTEKWRLHPNLTVGFLFSDFERTFQPLYLNTISLSPKVSYTIIDIPLLEVAPYANPFASLLLGLQSGGAFLDSETFDTFRGGIEGGIIIDVHVGNTSLRVIPIAAQLGNDFYRQGMVSLLFQL